MLGRKSVAPYVSTLLVIALSAGLDACSVDREAIFSYQPGEGRGGSMGGAGGAVPPGDGGGSPPGDGGDCVANPDPDSADVCPWICPEICDGKDNDCDGEIDEEEADESCALPQAVSECVDGECVIASCSDWYDDCDGEPLNGCETSLETLDNCGACGVVCTSECGDPVCEQGICTLSYCETGFGDCDCDSANGCETSLTTLSDCGACGKECDIANAVASCESGICTLVRCDPGFGDCDADLSNGCETSLDTLSDCGACATACDLAHASESCSTGACTLGACDEGFGDCDGDEGNGCETALDTLVDCGVCGEACDLLHADESCSTGTCALGDCDTGWGNCDSNDSTGCETELNTMSNCGACGAACSLPDAVASCSTGSCQIVSCDPGYADCNDAASDGCETLLMDVEDGLAGYWNLNESSGLVAHDTSGLGNDGSLTGMAGDEWTQGVVGGALQFDGVDDQVNVGSVGSSIRTFSFWVNSTYSGTVSSGQTGFQGPGSHGPVDEWNDPANAYLSDDSDASMSGTSKSQSWSGFGLQVPVGSSIYGIELSIEKSASDTSNNSSLDVELSWDGGSSFSTTGNSASFSNGSDDLASFGGSADTWGRVWTADEINNHLAVRLTGTVPGDSDTNFVYVDSIQVNVHHGTDTGWLSPSDHDSESWIDPGNAYASDNSYASMSGTSKSRDWSEFDFGIPSGATIDGVQVEVEKRASNTASNSTLAVELSWNGGLTYTSAGKSVSFSNGADDVATFGGAADTWGRIWIPAETSNANFRVRLRGSVPGDSGSNHIYVDHIQVTVHYTYSDNVGLSPAGGYGPSNEWANPANAYTSNNAYASMTGSNLFQDWSDFGLGVPAGATIDGLEVRVERSTDDTNDPSTIGVELSWNAGTSVTTTGNYVNFTNSTDLNSTFGGATNTWGRAWTDTELDNANFRVRLRGNSSIGGSTILVDWVRANAYYTHSTDTGPRSPSSYDLDNWVNPADAYASDDAYASMSGASKSQAWSGFGFSLPADAHLNGIEVMVEKSASYTISSSSLAVELSWDGGNTYTHSGKSVSFQNSADDTPTFGGRDDIWGRTWSQDDLGADNFRVRLTGAVPGDSGSRYIYVDQIRVRVYYATGLSGTGLKSPSATGSTNDQWTDPEKAYTSNDNHATVSSSNQQQDYSGFDLSVPAGSTVRGIAVVVEANSSGIATSATLEAELSWNAGSSYTSSGNSVSFTNGTDAILALGGCDDTWGRTWSTSDFSNASFRLRLTASPRFLGTVSIDTVQVEVYYSGFADQKIIEINGSAQIEIVDGDITPTAFPGTTAVYVDGSPGSTLTGGWHHVAVTDTTGPNASTFRLGRASSGYFQGLLDEVRIYDRALTPGEVAFLAGDDSCP
jgi:hypothetical protein